MATMLESAFTGLRKDKLQQAGVATLDELVAILQSDDAADRLACLRGIGGNMLKALAIAAQLDGVIDTEKRDAIYAKTETTYRRRYE